MTTSHHVVLLLMSMLVGSCVGSFLNVCVHRIPRRMSLFRPRSRCPHCSASIRARDNVPVLAWLWLRGRCRDCGGEISPRYALVELGAGLLFGACYLAAAALAGGDPWERSGGGAVIAGLVGSWSLTCTAIAWILILCDRGWSFRVGREAARRREAAGCGGPASAVHRPGGDPG